MGRWSRVPGTIVAALIAAALATPAAAEPVPPLHLSPAKLEARMDACMAYQVGEQEVLMGWRDFRTGRTRDWRCSSLRHMLLDDHGPGGPHDPYVDVVAFIWCTDKVVRFGFPRPGDRGNTVLNYQYKGTTERAFVVVNDVTGDIVSVYTRTPNDWIGCADGL